MKSYRIVLEYTTTNDEMTSPDSWDWHDLVAPNGDETISPVHVEEIDTPEGHLEVLLQDELGEDAVPDYAVLDELAEIAQKQDMGYPNAVGPSRFTVCVNCGTQILKKNAFVTTQGDVVCGDCADSTV